MKLRWTTSSVSLCLFYLQDTNAIGTADIKEGYAIEHADGTIGYTLTITPPMLPSIDEGPVHGVLPEENKLDYVTHGEFDFISPEAEGSAAGGNDGEEFGPPFGPALDPNTPPSGFLSYDIAGPEEEEEPIDCKGKTYLKKDGTTRERLRHCADDERHLRGARKH